MTQSEAPKLKYFYPMFTVMYIVCRIFNIYYQPDITPPPKIKKGNISTSFLKETQESVKLCDFKTIRLFCLGQCLFNCNLISHVPSLSTFPPGNDVIVIHSWIRLLEIHSSRNTNTNRDVWTVFLDLQLIVIKILRQ